MTARWKQQDVLLQQVLDRTKTFASFTIKDFDSRKTAKCGRFVDQIAVLINTDHFLVLMTVLPCTECGCLC